MRKYVQLYLGGPGGRAVSEEAMRAALDPMERAESFAGVIAGWTVPARSPIGGCAVSHGSGG